MDGSCSRASAFASCRKRASIPGVQAISGWRTLQARRRSRSLSHSSYTSAKPPRPIRRLTSYLAPSARARRSAVGTAGGAPAAGGVAVARSSVITVGEAEPHAGQKAAPRGISARHDGQVSWVVTARKIRDWWPAGNARDCVACRAPTYFRCMLALRIIVGLGLAYLGLLLL